MFKILTIPFDREKETFFEEELNKFTINKKIISHTREFFINDSRPYWTIFLEYETPLEKADTEGLSEPEMLLYERLRQWRREKAEERGFPVYVICNNKQLKSIIKERPVTLEALKKTEGFGKKKIEDYGNEIIKIIKDFYSKK